MIGVADWGSFWQGVLVTLGGLLVVAGWSLARKYSDEERDGHCLACGGKKRSPRRGCVALFHQEAG